jgi:1,2-dihydroxy-3-keto-5-methylthiopentene dioxygenase
MSELKIFADDDPSRLLLKLTTKTDMATELAKIGVRYEQWSAHQPIAPGSAPEEVIAAYRKDIDRLIAEEGYQAVDVVSLTSDHPDKATLRRKFQSEHTHGEDEVRFFVAGSGLFSLHVGDRIYEILCTQGDLLSVPARTKHWFDMGPNPHFVAIRLFDNPSGWVAEFTGWPIAERFSRLEN